MRKVWTSLLLTALTAALAGGCGGGDTDFDESTLTEEQQQQMDEHFERLEHVREMRDESVRGGPSNGG
ncbi:MAG: hypothetical protein ACLFV4_12040 [Candidatus Hydrogenedentota bacterium]